MPKVDLAARLSDARERLHQQEPVEERAVPKYARMVKKDALIRPDQMPALTGLAGTLMARRAVKTERITENTLIRVAIDLLLVAAPALRGSTEDELRESASSTVQNLATSGDPNSGTPDVPNVTPSSVRDFGTPELLESVIPTRRTAHD